MEREEARPDDAAPSEEDRNPEGGPGGGVNVNAGWTPDEGASEPGPETGEDAPEEASGTLPAA